MLILYIVFTEKKKNRPNPTPAYLAVLKTIFLSDITFALVLKPDKLSDNHGKV